MKTVSSRQHKYTYPCFSQVFPKYTPSLVLASAFCLSQIGDALVQRGEDLEEEDFRGVRALHQSIWENHGSLAEYLLAQGADPNVLIHSQTTPLHSAEAMQGSSLHLAAIKGNQISTQELLSRGSQVNSRLENGWTPLHMAAANGHVDVVTLLASHGAGINTADSHGATSIYRAAENGHEKAIDMLIGQEGDVNIRTKLDQTPLLRAAENRHESTVKLLLERGANWKIKDYLG